MQDKTVKVGGNTTIEIDGDKLTVTPDGGLIVVTVTDLSGNVVYMHHPLSGWYIEMDLREEKEE